MRWPPTHAGEPTTAVAKAARQVVAYYVLTTLSRKAAVTVAHPVISSFRSVSTLPVSEPVRPVFEKMPLPFSDLPNARQPAALQVSAIHYPIDSTLYAKRAAAPESLRKMQANRKVRGKLW